MKKRGFDFSARLKYLTTEEGGRSTPAHSGYRPGILFPFDPMQTTGHQVFRGTHKVNPGEEVIADISIPSVDYFAKKIKVGLIFKFCEGPITIGHGEIIEIFNKKLIKNTSN